MFLFTFTRFLFLSRTPLVWLIYKSKFVQYHHNHEWEGLQNAIANTRRSRICHCGHVFHPRVRNDHTTSLFFVLIFLPFNFIATGPICHSFFPLFFPCSLVSILLFHVRAWHGHLGLVSHRARCAITTAATWPLDFTKPGHASNLSQNVSHPLPLFRWNTELPPSSRTPTATWSPSPMSSLWNQPRHDVFPDLLYQLAQLISFLAVVRPNRTHLHHLCPSVAVIDCSTVSEPLPSSTLSYSSSSHVLPCARPCLRRNSAGTSSLLPTSVFVCLWSAATHR